jgi:serine/threonine protein kinase
VTPSSGKAPSSIEPATAAAAPVEEGDPSLVAAQAGRHDQAASIEAELAQLQAIYERMSTDLEVLRAERDDAVAAARREREARARETLVLSERLDALLGERLPPTDSVPTEAPRPVPPARADASASLRAGSATPELSGVLPGEKLPEVPGYRLQSILGRGGMSVVYRGVRESDGAEVAVKLLDPKTAAAAGREDLLLRETAALLRLSHPGLVRALDAGECAHGRYLVLELVHGESLAGRVRRKGPLTESEAVEVALQAARALAYCACLGLTHRDVKPSNLLVDAAGRVRLCDFGLAALCSGADPARPYGSPGYAAPEQIADPETPDARVDVYALGCTLWHLVVGRRPFQSPGRHAFDVQREEDLSDPRFEGADVSAHFAQVIRRMGCAERVRRYRGWDEVILDLMLVANGNPPFSAHLAEAIETSPKQSEGGAAAPAGAPEPEAAGASPRPPAGPSVAPPPAAAPEDHREFDTITNERLERSRAKSGASPAGRGRSPSFFAALCAVGALAGFAAASLLQPSAAAEFESRARQRALAGDADGAVRSLRAAAELLVGEDRTRLLRAAERIEKGSAR